MAMRPPWEARAVPSLLCRPASASSVRQRRWLEAPSPLARLPFPLPAPTGNAVVTLSSSNSALTVPGSVTVSAGATSATFTATAGSPSTNQSATVTASYGGGTATATISVLAAIRVSSLVCTPASLGANGNSACTVTLTQAAPSGGAFVSLSDNAAALTVPASVTVAAAATTSARFHATTGSLTVSQTAIGHGQLQRQFRNCIHQPGAASPGLFPGVHSVQPGIEFE